MKHYTIRFFAALVCCALLLAFLTGAGVNAEGVVISGADSILIYNPRPAGNKLTTGTLPTVTTTNGAVDYAADVVYPGALAHPIVSGDRSTLAKRRQSTDYEAVANYNVDDKKEFVVYDFDSNEYFSVEFTLYASSDTCYVWVCEGVDQEQRLNEYQALTLCNNFTNTVYTSVSTHFGPFRDVDGSGHVNILTFPMNAGIAGFFDSYDLYTREEIQIFDPDYADSYNCAPIINVNSVYASYSQLLLSTLAHEYQHLVNFSATLQAPANNNLFDDGIHSPLWLNEAFAMESEELTYPGEVEAQGYIGEFNIDNKVIGGGSSLTTFNNELSEYARGFLFSEYIKHQSGGSAVFRKVLRYWSAQETLSALNVEAALQYALGADTVARVNAIEYTNTVSQQFFSKLALSFYLSLVLDKDEGLFSLPASCDNASFPYYGKNSATIDGGGAILIASDGSFEVPANAGTGLIYVGIKDGEIVSSYGLGSDPATATPGTTPTATPTSTATIKPTAVPTPTATVKPTATPTVKPTATSTATASATPPNPILYGDSNGDGVISASDAALILRHLVNLDTIAEECMVAANCDRSGEIGAHDAALILRYLVGLELIKQD